MSSVAARKNTSSPGLDHRVGGRRDRGILAVDRRDARIDLRQVLADHTQRIADHGPALERAHRHHAHQPVGELDHLQRLGEFHQLHDVVGDLLLGRDGEVDREVVLVQQLGCSR
jgi:hypothetical protein